MAYTDTTLSTAVPIKAVHISELATALTAVATTAKKTSSIDLSGLTYNKINVSNMNILQDTVHTLQSLFSGNCCQADCCQTCQTSTCQTYSCQSTICQSSSCQTQTCQTCQGCQGCQSASCQTQTCQSVSCQGCQYYYYWTADQTNCAPQCDCNCDASCFMEGTMVRVFKDGKYSRRPIEKITVGDIVVGPNGSLNPVLAPYTTLLGKNRYIMQIKSLRFTAEQSFWVKRGSIEQFGVHDYDAYAAEHNNIDALGLSLHLKERIMMRMRYGPQVPLYLTNDLRSVEPITINDVCEYATADGWQKGTATKYDATTPNTRVYALCVGGNHMYYADDFLVGDFVTDIDCDYTKIHAEPLADEIKGE